MRLEREDDVLGRDRLAVVEARLGRSWKVAEEKSAG